MTNSMNKKVLALVLAASLPMLAAAQAPIVQTVQKDPEGVVSLSSSATVQVPNDWITVQFSTSKEGVDANAVQAALKDALATALAQSRQVAKPDGHVEVQGGGFSLQPRFNNKGVVNGWSGTTSLTVQGRDMGTIAELAGRIQSMTVGNLDYSVSREAREKVEGDVAAQAIARFRAKAADYAKAFGFATFVVREANVGIDNGQPTPRPFRAKIAMAANVGDALPVEAGSGTVTANVNGSVQLK
ncbi:SIMPL domain-containing protein [Scleromatobacter humisilvae]|uniref:SIMPL domain-containing protein n=1 Tax=Scleromatobacter humisilvae TaxID=2897159 RepID=A0A9X1YIG3_9BURK|nr:SIMPL domain-containing protein [Scleromatobacter humisilvae]MCK9686516.1 SIMPL domain-containing protein [Scleromatobacter humisilvae]